ncbi:uncharacterized protein N7515_008731 [Penicillium bovifimosum]|uniref:Yeast cell wall synthesis Kre9/Knh1-like N-terminal domain-containing protein n=1 Tax=Penicillium bovifimosum TaxID=126998 RepID=A0A9W9GNN3_9EURO|nr:uncharacterized protein N7515_008731 [Penicillium bovifimosum]KAJ5124906.1 hypothetical protein N7515_008731 [Penicillium bovifimosum]
MHFSQKVIAVMATLMTLGLAADPLSFTSWPKEPLEAGKPVTLTWTGAVPDQPVTILLRKGSSGNLKDVKAITDEARDGTFTWTPDDDIKRGQTYAFQIRQADQTNYTALLKSAGKGKPAADVPEAQEATTGAQDTTVPATGTTTAPSTQSTGPMTEPTQETQTTLNSTGSRALISSSATPSGSPSSSALSSSSDVAAATGTEIVNNQEPSSTDIVSTGDASAPKYSVQLVMGVAGLLAYLV